MATAVVTAASAVVVAGRIVVTITCPSSSLDDVVTTTNWPCGFGEAPAAETLVLSAEAAQLVGGRRRMGRRSSSTSIGGSSRGRPGRVVFSSLSLSWSLSSSSSWFLFFFFFAVVRRGNAVEVGDDLVATPAAVALAGVARAVAPLEGTGTGAARQEEVVEQAAEGGPGGGGGARAPSSGFTTQGRGQLA